MLATIRSTYDSNGPGVSDNEILKRYAAVPVLALDDVGKENLSRWTVDTLYTLINRRYENALPIILTSNFNPRQLAEREVAKDAEPVTYASIQDRLAEMVGTWVQILGDSRR
jgi:DNA replication protein DnaC